MKTSIKPLSKTIALSRLDMLVKQSVADVMQADEFGAEDIAARAVGRLARATARRLENKSKTISVKQVCTALVQELVDETLNLNEDTTQEELAHLRALAVVFETLA